VFDAPPGDERDQLGDVVAVPAGERDGERDGERNAGRIGDRVVFGTKLAPVDRTGTSEASGRRRC
jgi:co-chaperonin GroES (HSP10)